MFKHYIGWKTLLALIATLIIAATIIYANTLARKIADEEKKKVQLWVQANKTILQASPDDDINLSVQIITNNTTIPIIGTDNNGKIIDFRNIDSSYIKRDKDYLQKQVTLFKSQHSPIVMSYNPDNPNEKYYFYYGDSLILKQLRYYPYIQLFIFTLFIIVTIIALTTTNKSTQNQVWVGLAKETAHQLGTPLSSMEAWLELLRENTENEPIVQELGKDLDRLKLITERFSKIGSVPVLEERDLVNRINSMMSYIKKRAPKKITFSLLTHGEEEIPAMISPPLFDWVIENLLKNALDAMEGEGSIMIEIRSLAASNTIDISDTGKGIPKGNFDKVFKPGFSTKKRGWGLGLSLSKRIIQDYHKGRLSVKSSELGKGTTFRILLRK